MGLGSKINPKPSPGASLAGRLRRDLGTVESYAALIGILIGAGIFTVTSHAWTLTGPSVILGYIVLMPIVLATAVAYVAFLSTPLGKEPGGEYTHISRTFDGDAIAFVGAWLKIISYIGAAAFLANALADYGLELAGSYFQSGAYRLYLALGSLVFFYLVHVAGVRWVGRVQVMMCALLGLSLMVLIVPGLFAIHWSNYKPFITRGFGGFAASLVPLFFSYAGFESLAQAAGEVKDSTKRLPRIFINGISATAIIYVLMSVVAFGVLPGALLQVSRAPMTEVAAVYLPIGAAWFVTFGAIMAITTSLNSTMLVPSRLAIILAQDRLAPRWSGSIYARTGTPVWGLTATLAASALLLLSGQVSLALNVSILALVILYFLHSLAFLLLPRCKPDLFAQVAVSIPVWIQRSAALISVVAMAGLIMVQASQDLHTLHITRLRERVTAHSLTSLELILVWGLIGMGLYSYGRWRRTQATENTMARLETHKVGQGLRE